MIEKFLKSLKENEHSKESKGIGAINKTPEYVVDCLLEDLNRRTIKLQKIKPKGYQKFNDVLFKYTTDHMINRPMQIQKVEIEEKIRYLVASRYKSLAILDENLNFIQYWGEYGDPTTSNGFLYTNRVILDIERDLIIFLTDWRHFMRAYKFSTKEKLWDFGVFNESGNPEDGKLYTPRDICFAPNGNILVANYYGSIELNGSRTPNNGIVVEIDAATGEFVKTHLYYKSTGYGWDNEVLNPQVIKNYEDKIYIATSRDSIDIYSYQNDKLVYEKSLNKPKNSGFDNIDIRDFIIKENEITVLSGALRKVISVDIETMTIKNAVGYFKYEDGSYFEHQTNALNSPYSIIEFDDMFIVADYGNNQIVKVYRNAFKDVAYELPDDIGEILYTNLEIDSEGIATMYKHIQEDDLILIYRGGVNA